jgi:hypothetical protein
MEFDTIVIVYIDEREVVSLEGFSLELFICLSRVTSSLHLFEMHVY